MPEPRYPASAVLTELRRIMRSLALHSRQLSRNEGLTVPQVVILRAVVALAEDGGDVTISRVSQSVQLSDATVSRVVERLVQANLVERNRSTVDRRRLSLGLTPAGRERFNSLPAPLQADFIERWELLSSDEQASIITALERLVALMNASDLKPAPFLASHVPYEPDGTSG